MSGSGYVTITGIRFDVESVRIVRGGFEIITGPAQGPIPGQRNVRACLFTEDHELAGVTNRCDLSPVKKGYASDLTLFVPIR